MSLILRSQIENVGLKLKLLAHPFEVSRRVRRHWAVQREIRSRIEQDGATPPPPRSRRPRTFPDTADAVRKASFFTMWWFYDVEVLPGVVTQGIFPPTLPMLPRMLLRRCGLEGMSCLDIGTSDGLVPVVMGRRGATEILAIDAIDVSLEKLEALKHYYRVDFEFQAVGLMYDLQRKIPGGSFDLINCSGLLYHVYSPLQVLAGVRALVKRNGLMIVSTGVVNVDGHVMEFNNAGRIQAEANTFW